MDDQPFTIVKKDEFRNIVLYLKPNANIPLADTIRRDLDTKFDQVKIQVYNKLQVII